MITLEKAIHEFLVDREIKGNTQKTIKNYNQFLKYFTEYIGKNIKVNEITLNDIKKYQLNLSKKTKYENHPLCSNYEKNKNISKTSIQSYMRHLRVFINYLGEEGYIPEEIGRKFKLPKAPKKTIEILSDSEIDTLLNNISEKSELQVRNKCIICLMLDSGLRKNEVIELGYDNVHLSQNIIKVFGKGEKERLVPIGLLTKKLLLKYMQMYRPMPEFETKRLFISKEKKPISDKVIEMIIRRLKKKTGINRLHPHILRHTFATQYLINGGDIFSLQQILGHTSLEMVRRYSHLASSYVLANHKKLSPLDNLYKRNNNF